MHRMPAASTLRRAREALRWEQYSSSRPILLSLSRKATKSSPGSCTRRGSQSGAGSSSDNRAGSQNLRKAVPIAVPDPTRQISSLFSLVSMASSRLSPEASMEDYCRQWRSTEAHSYLRAYGLRFVLNQEFKGRIGVM